MNDPNVWNGYTVYGDSSELDRIIATPSIISLDKNDIVGVLSCDGEHRIVIGEGIDIRSALNVSLTALGYHLEKATAMIVNIYCKDKSLLLMSEISSMLEPIKECLHSDCDVTWGIAEDKDMKCPRKITLLVTSNV